VAEAEALDLELSHNPTTEVVEIDFFHKIVDSPRAFHAGRARLGVCNIHVRRLRARRASSRCRRDRRRVEFFSLSKSYSMARVARRLRRRNREMIHAPAHQELSRLRHVPAGADAAIGR